MNHLTRTGVLFILGVFAVVALSTTGCSKPKVAEVQPTPKVAPPAVKEAGTLRVGIDMKYPPFGGTDNGQQAGIDVDVAAALAERLGLKLAVVQVKSSDAATQLANGAVDVVLSVPFSAEGLSNVTLAGSYASDAPAFFVAAEGTASAAPAMTMQTLPPPPAKIGAQKGSEAYWMLVRALEPGTVQGYPTLRDALEALSKGGVRVVAGDALIGTYIARDFPTVHFAGQMALATLLGAAVLPDNATLADATREALDGLASDGVLDAIRGKWVGGLPKLKVLESDASSGTSDTATQ